MEAPTKYAKSGNVHIAYRVFGNGPRDIILVPGTVSHVELYWELRANAYLLRRLATFARDIVFVVQGSQIDITNLAKGKHHFRCCIHPWMRMEVDVQ